MPLSAEEIRENEAALANPDISAEERTIRLETKYSYDDEHLNGTLGPALTGAFSLIPQALAVQPATTHPAGDDVAEEEWLRSGGADAKGAVIVYDVPLSAAQKDLLEHPEKVRALYPDAPPGSMTPEEIMAMKPDSQLYKDYQAQTWRDTAEAAAAGGKAAYRYSQAPWLHTGGGVNSVLDNLKLKAEGAVQPFGEGVTAFVMGVDDTANLGIGRAATEAAGADMSPLNPLGSERYGGVTDPNTREHTAQLEEEYPALYMLGQGLGIGTGWGAANELFKQALGQGAKAATRLGGGTLARIGTGTVAGAVGAAGVQAGQDLVDIGANQLSGTDGGPDLSEVPERAAHAGYVGLPFAALGSGVQSLARAGAEDVRWGDRYNGTVGNLERDVPDMEFRPLAGPRSKSIQELKVQARKANVAPGDLVAEQVAPPIAKVLDEDVKGVFQQVNKTKQEYLSSGEGQAKLPTTNFMKATLEELRADMAANKVGDGPKPGIPEPVGTPDAGGELKSFFNTQVESVSLEPVKGAIAMTPEEAQAFLIPLRQKELLRAKPVKAPSTKTEPFAPAADLPRVKAHGSLAVGPATIEAPPAMVKPTKPGAGDWQSPRGIEAGEPITPDRTVTASNRPLGEPGGLERRQTQLDTEAAYRGGFLPTRPGEPVPRGYDQVPREKGLRGNREPATGTPPAPTGKDLPAETREAPATTGAPSRAPTPKGGPRSAEAKAPKDDEGDVADTLRARGVETVYVVPRRYNAEHHETLLDKIGAISKKTNRDLSKLDQAARVDRDARPLNGEAGGWSRLQNQHSELIERAKLAEQLGAPGGDSFKVLTSYGKQKSGQKPLADTVRDAADRAGVREQLDKLRNIEPYEDLTKQARFEASRTQPNRGRLQSAADFATIRAFPFMRALEGPLGLGGQAGRAANMGRDEDEKARRKKQLEEKSK